MKNISLLILAGAIVLLTAVIYGTDFTPEVNIQQAEQQSLGAVTNYLDTSASGFTSTTSTVNTTGTQVFSSVSKRTWLFNNTTSTFTCSADATGTTGASSTVAAGRGILIGPNSGTIIPALASFGECNSGIANCYAHKGALNCVANVAATIVKVVQ